MVTWRLQDRGSHYAAGPQAPSHSDDVDRLRGTLEDTRRFIDRFSHDTADRLAELQRRVDSDESALHRIGECLRC